jgi:3-polyprenyl-4-hydroxybenzoate decarboxylase
MERKFIVAVAALIFWAVASFNAGNIIKVVKDINIDEEQKVDNAIADSIQADKTKSFFRGAPGTLMIASFLCC